MLFALQKIIWFLVLPPTIIAALIIGGLILNAYRPKPGRAMIIAGVVLFYLLSINLTADFILRPLERFAPPTLPPGIVVDAVVVPGGGAVDLRWLDADPILNSETSMRLMKGVEIAKFLDVPLVVTGGNGEPFATTITEGDVMARAASEMGMPKERIIMENESRNTLENSLAVRKLLKGDRIVLVTSAYHMKRAAGMFRKRGFQVTPVSTYFLSQMRKLSLSHLIPRAGSFNNSTVGIAERYSLIWWGIRGEW